MYKNYDELEEYLTIQELTETYRAIVEKEERHNRFLAAVMGAEMEESATEAVKTYGGSDAPDAGSGIAYGQHNGQTFTFDTSQFTGHRVIED